MTGHAEKSLLAENFVLLSMSPLHVKAANEDKAHVAAMLKRLSFSCYSLSIETDLISKPLYLFTQEV